MEENINYSTNNLNVQWMEWCEHIRLRTGMHIGRIGDGSNPCDGVYTLFTQILNNSIDEFRRGFGNLIEVTVDCNSFSVRDYGLGIEPKMALQDEYCEMSASQNQGVPLTITIGGIYWGLRLNIALSSSFTIVSHRQAKEEWMKAKNGVIVASGCGISKCPQGTLVSVSPDAEIFGENTIRQQYIEKIVKTSVCPNPGLTILLNGKKYKSENGLLDIVNEHLTEGISYPPIHLKGKNIEIVLVHSQRKESDITSFVNGHFTKDGAE
jgi:topoisomerase-4 subunit B